MMCAFMIWECFKSEDSLFQASADQENIDFIIKLSAVLVLILFQHPFCNILISIVCIDLKRFYGKGNMVEKS